MKNIQVDSSRIEAGDLFIAIRGVNNDGHSFISHAIERGAQAVCLENKSFLLENSDVVQIVVKDTRSALATIASNFYSNPASKTGSHWNNRYKRENNDFPAYKIHS